MADKEGPRNDSSSYINESLVRWRKYFDGPLIALILASIPLLILEIARTEMSSADQLFLDAVNAFIFAVFLIDYVVEILLSSKCVGDKQQQRHRLADYFSATTPRQRHGHTRECHGHCFLDCTNQHWRQPYHWIHRHGFRRGSELHDNRPPRARLAD